MIRRLALVPLLLMLAAGSTRADSLRLSNADLDAVLAQDDGTETPALPDADDTAGAAPRRWWPIVASAVVPGLGEITTGHMRGIPMIVVDAAIWTGVYIKNDEGAEKEEEFEDFADEHWSEDEWTTAVTTTGGNFHDWYPQYNSPDDIPLYVSKEEDEREWYENLGKWDEFAWGWREYWDDIWNAENNPDFIGPDLYAPQVGLSDTWFYPDNAKMTPLRKQYIEMRDESNSAYETRDTFLSAALLLRVVSVLQVVYLEGFVGRRYDAPDATGLDLSAPQASWSAQAGATGSGVVAWRMTW